MTRRNAGTERPRCRRRASRAAILLAATLAACAGRFVRLERQGLPCGEAYNLAIQTVRRMGYEVEEASRPVPGVPGMVRAGRADGTRRRGMLVHVVCTTLGSEVEARTESGGLAEVAFPAEFQRHFEKVASVRLPDRPAQEAGVDVLLTPGRADSENGMGIDLSGSAALPVRVRITNRTVLRYRFVVGEVVLRSAGGARARPLAPAAVLSKLAPAAAAVARERLLGDRDIAPGAVLEGVLFFPFDSYVGARVVLTESDSGEPEGFAIEF